VIVLVPGLGVAQRYFDRLARELDDELLRPTLDQPASIAALADGLESQVTGASVVVAHSLGCQVATVLAVRRPELVERLVLIGPTVDPHARSVVRQALRLALDAWYEPPSLVATVVREYARHGGVRQGRYAVSDRIEERLPLVAAPTVVVRGANDPVCPAAWARTAADLLPAGRLVTIAGAAHAAHASHPREVAEIVTRG
jgi:2-hydroxy-6-oxonona-2,4-dienedioate hydrolase